MRHLFLLLIVAGHFVAAAETPLVTGNGFGFAVFDNGAVTKLYAHPYKFSAPNHADPYGDGVQTENLIKKMAWEANGPAAYWRESHVIGSTKQFYFMPFGLERPALVMVSQAPVNSCPAIEWEHPLKSRRMLHAGGMRSEWLRFKGIDESILRIPVGADAGCQSNAWILIVIEKNADRLAAMTDFKRWQAGLAAAQLLNRELRDLEKWRVTPAVKFRSDFERRLWRQSETILRMAQSREPNRPGRYNHGLIVAALPEGGWFMPWVRDMSYAVQALIRMGHKRESRWAIEAFFNARPIGRVKNMVRGFPYQVSVVCYFGDGSEETNFGGENAPNVEFDNWGLVLSMLTDYVETFNDMSLLAEPGARGPLFSTARDFIVRPLLGNLDSLNGGGHIVTKDTSIWEANAGSEEHFAFSTALAINGIRGFSRLSERRGEMALYRRLDRAVASLQKGFRAAFTGGGFVRGTLEPDDVYHFDSAVLEVFNFNAISDPSLMHETLKAMENLRMASGGYRRIRGDRQYDKQEFVFSDFNWARNYSRLGHPEIAQPLMETIVSRALADHGFIPEMYVSEINDEYPGAIGAPTGAVPMVGYGAGMFITYLIERP